MKQTSIIRRMALTFLVPIPASLAFTFILVYGIGTNRWGGLQTLFHTGFRSIGLAGNLYEFPWSWMTVFFIQIAIPYSLFVMIMHHLRSRKMSGVPEQRSESLNWPMAFGLVAVAGTMTLILSRGLFALGHAILPDLPSTASDSIHRLVSFVELFSTLALPFAILCVVAYQLSRRHA